MGHPYEVRCPPNGLTPSACPEPAELAGRQMPAWNRLRPLESGSDGTSRFCSKVVMFHDRTCVVIGRDWVTGGERKHVDPGSLGLVLTRVD